MGNIIKVTPKLGLKFGFSSSCLNLKSFHYQFRFKRLLLYPLLFSFSLYSRETKQNGLTNSGFIDLTYATIVTRDGELSLIEQSSVNILIEEVEKRTGIKWNIVTERPKSGFIITILNLKPEFSNITPLSIKLRSYNDESYGIITKNNEIGIGGYGSKGILNGIGKFLRTLEMVPGKIILRDPLNIASSPYHKIRGHQLGYRPLSNSYDAWTPEVYDQYIRELAIFGVNAIENIPLSGGDNDIMPISRMEMNRALSNICSKYGMEYWVWTPATVDLSNPEKRAAHLLEHETFYKESPKLDAVFFPGGDPGDNHPRHVMPFLADLSVILKRYHPTAKIWMSLQGFNEKEINYFFDWIVEHKPDWFGGAVGGPASPPLPYIRGRLPGKYKLRDYPDITHTVRSQYPTPWLDPAIAFTSGREGTNPEPVYYSTIFRHNQEFIDGFITYSDGIHDDVNKIVYSMLGWDKDLQPYSIILDYVRFFFGVDASINIANSIFNLEKNWDGPLQNNPNVFTTFQTFEALGKSKPELQNNWRWQLLQLKAHYDAYIKVRLDYEQRLEKEVNEILGEAEIIGAKKAMDKARVIFSQADEKKIYPYLREKIIELCEQLNQSIGYQSSILKYGAHNPERSAVLDYIDYPLNNRWWVEDQFVEIRKLDSEENKIARLDIIRKWENPGPGSFYDDIGNVAKSDQVLRGKPLSEDPLMQTNPNPDFMWWDDGMARVRQTWVSKMDWPIGLQYNHLDKSATYILRTTGYGQCLVRVNSERIYPTIDEKGIGEIKEFFIPKSLYKNGSITLTFDIPHEPKINWRQQSRLSEVWLIKK